MECVQIKEQILLALVLLVTMVYTRSVDLPHEKDSGDFKIHDQLSDAWESDNMSRDEWYRCHGIPCDQWERTKHKLKMLKVLAAQATEEPRFSALSNLDDEAKNMMFNEQAILYSLQKYNIPDTDDLDGCIWLTEEQIDEMLHNQGVTNKMMGSNHMRHKRTLDKSVASGGFKRWPNGIVHFKFDGSHTSSEKTTVRNAMSHIEQNTCVRFKELGTHESFDDHHVLITRYSTGCHSFVGRTSFKPQQLNLQAACLYNFGVPVHELGHMLGLWHEMQRWDRDQYINVLYENIGAYASQFTKLRTNNDVEYDPGSVLHYSGKDGAVSYQKNSMETKNPLYQRNMGQRVELSFLDAMSINQAYCSDTCAGQPLGKDCKRGGYQDPNDCSRCKCPPGFTGQYCEYLAPSKSNCGGEYTLSSSNPSVTIQSPGYSGGAYDNHDECNWQFKGENGQKVSLEFIDDFGVYCSYSYQCFHWVEVQYELNKNTHGPRFCCRDRPTATVVSDGDEMTVLFRSNFTVSSRYSRRGFKARITLVPGSNGAQTTTTSTTSTTTSTTTTTPRTTTTTPTTTTSTTTTTTQPTTTTRREDGECTKVDLSFALDSSGSVTQTNWFKLRQFTKDIISRFDLSSQCAQFSVISIGNRAHVNSYLNEHYNNINSIIDNLPFRDEWTNTASAFKAMTTDIYTSAKGERSGAVNVALLLTDGPSNRDQQNTIPYANEARNTRNMQFLTIGIGDDVSRSELLAITGNDADRNSYVDNFNQLFGSQFQDQIVNKIKALASGNTGNMPTTSSTTTTSTTTTTTTTTTTQPPNVGSQSDFECKFETSANQPTWCGIVQSSNDQFDWTITNVRTPSDETGADRAHSGSYYIFIEASSPRRMNDQARIQLPAVASTGEYCISFAYHMYGFHIDSLTVNNYASDGSRAELWTKRAAQGNFWKTAAFSRTLKSGDRIEFVGQRGMAFSGDIGLDTISVRRGNC